MDLLFLGEERCTNTVHWSVTPSLQIGHISSHPRTVEIDGANLVVETALAIQVFEELHVSFTSPEVKVTDLEVAPDYEQRWVSYTLSDTAPVNSIQ